MPDFDPNAASSPNSGAFGLPHSAEEAKVILVPVPFEATTSYGGGTVDGPRAVLEASRQVDLFDIETGRPYLAGIHMLEEPEELRRLNAEAKRTAQPVVEAGGVFADRPELGAAAQKVNDASDQVNGWVYRTVKAHLSRGKRIGVVGGDHSVSYGSVQAHLERYPELGILHLDAHADLRDAFEGFTWSHASIFHNVMSRLPVKRLVQVGIRDLGEAEHAFIEGSDGRIKTFFDATLAEHRFSGMPWKEQVWQIVEALPKEVYLSFDIDGLDPTLCPHTGTPVPGGLSYLEACALVGGVVKSGRRIVGCDLTEVAPGPEGDQWDGNVGARLLYKMIGWMLRSDG